MKNNKNKSRISIFVSNSFLSTLSKLIYTSKIKVLTRIIINIKSNNSFDLFDYF